ncbi:heparinase II/III family protein [Parvularcula sp. IMCC14364]|uniref:heparinase II/III family protein n=1 Tax=Parvularcula sp. IMCC14364 TaxID=3067902 RepID=UPI0027413367|nr:heparinase II/III family protein [Parvularcula sp. IMCC14364]
MAKSSRKQTPYAANVSARKPWRHWHDGLFYELQLNGPAPDRLTFNLVNPYKPDTTDAIELLKQYENEQLHISSISQHQEGFLTPWRDLCSEDLKYRRYHSFAWLAGMAAGGQSSLPAARAMVDGWLHYNEKYQPETWHPHLVCDRLWHLARDGQWLMRGAEATWRSRLLSSMARQTRHLAKAVARVEEPVERLFSAMTLILMGLALPHHRTCEEQGSTLLRRELRLQLRADGGHISRNPSLQLRITLCLQDLMKAYRLLSLSAPNFLHHAVSRTTDMTEFFRCGDGRLAVFNQGTEDDPKALARALSFDSVARNRIDFASQSGFQRLYGARTYLYADIGVPAASPGRVSNEIADSAKGTFAIQFSAGRQRIITNCGSANALATPDSGLSLAEYRQWHEALAGPDAHSGLCVDGVDTPFSGTARNGAGGNSYHHLEEDRHGQLLELERTDVPGATGCTHRRRLFLGIDGDDLRGEDVLIPPGGESAPKWLLRFHLYPGIKASLSRDRHTVILVTPQNEGWRFIAGDAMMELAPSIYCGVEGPVQKIEQIIVKPARARGVVQQVKWALKK